ncbi:hypothetical protein ADUPG1_007702 [Aduncisulcus paluster]|uniref:Myb-like domain-containing protein n=1 Tax=Aduncisulcus paluster TaxID=2918883 RepID=A0ABQ5KRT9_9EUKA|nr:hypothetical protein ADUPG1_007702 [Aduncisulcus paluster]
MDNFFPNFSSWIPSQLEHLKKMISSSHTRNQQRNWIDISRCIGKTPIECESMAKILLSDVKPQKSFSCHVNPKFAGSLKVDRAKSRRKIVSKGNSKGKSVDTSRKHLSWTEEEILQSVFLHSRLRNRWKLYEEYSSISRRPTQVKCKIFNLRSKGLLGAQEQKIKSILEKNGISWTECSIRKGLSALGVKFEPSLPESITSKSSLYSSDTQLSNCNDSSSKDESIIIDDEQLYVDSSLSPSIGIDSPEDFKSSLYLVHNDHQSSVTASSSSSDKYSEFGGSFSPFSSSSSDELDDSIRDDHHLIDEWFPRLAIEKVVYDPLNDLLDFLK